MFTWLLKKGTFTLLKNIGGGRGGGQGPLPPLFRRPCPLKVLNLPLRNSPIWYNTKAPLLDKSNSLFSFCYFSSLTSIGQISILHFFQMRYNCRFKKRVPINATCFLFKYSHHFWILSFKLDFKISFSNSSSNSNHKLLLRILIWTWLRGLTSAFSLKSFWDSFLNYYSKFNSKLGNKVLRLNSNANSETMLRIWSIVSQFTFEFSLKALFPSLELNLDFVINDVNLILPQHVSFYLSRNCFARTFTLIELFLYF